MIQPLFLFLIKLELQFHEICILSQNHDISVNVVESDLYLKKMFLFFSGVNSARLSLLDCVLIKVNKESSLEFSILSNKE